jgi:hypothetical protein
MFDLAELAIREAVRDTIACYTHAGDRGRLEELAAQFTPDGILEVHGSYRYEGRAAIVAGLGGTVSRNRKDAAGTGLPPIVRHQVSSIRIHGVTQERAEAESYFAVLSREGLDHWGRYRDVLVPFEGRWLFAHRFVRTDAYAAGSPYAEKH